MAKVAGILIARRFGRVLSSDDAHNKKQFTSSYALGWMFGMIDATMQFYGVDRSSQEALAIIRKSVKDLFDPDPLKVMEMALGLQKDEIFDAAKNIAGKLTYETLSTGTERQPPEALASLFRPLAPK